MQQVQEKLIGAKHLALLGVARRRLRLADDVWRDLLKVQAGKTSAKELTFAEFELVLRRCEQLGFVSTAHQRFEAAALYEVVTPAQQAKIQELYGKLGWDGRRQSGFNRRQIRKGWPQSQSEASRIIEALKKMVARGYSERTPQSNPVPSNPDNPP